MLEGGGGGTLVNECWKVGGRGNIGESMLEGGGGGTLANECWKVGEGEHW